MAVQTITDAPGARPWPSRAGTARSAFVEATQRSRRLALLTLRAAAWLVLPLSASAQIGNGEAVVDLVSKPAGVGLGWLISAERSPYRGDGQQRDIAPAYLYEGERFFLRSDRFGLKFESGAQQAIDVYLRRRVEGLPLDRLPLQLQGLTTRNGGVDLGLTWRRHLGERQIHASVTQNVGHDARGLELGVGAFTDWQLGRWTLRPAASVTWRSRRSNGFYYGVSADEATPDRPAYQPGAGIDLSAGLYGSYRLTEGWRLIGGVGATRYSRTVRASPIVEPGTHGGAVFGAVYSLAQEKIHWQAEQSPTWVRVLYGRAAEDRCNIAMIVMLRCTAINNATPTEVVGLTVGKTLVEGFRGWPLDLVGYAGFIHHHDRPFQRDGGEVNLFMKAYFRGLPWTDRVLTRIGLGWGITIADPVPYAEVLEQASRGRRTSRVLNYIDPSIDLSLGDAIGRPQWKQTFVGLGVTHRSGMFANSRLLGRVIGGSNYIVLYVEHPFGP